MRPVLESARSTTDSGERSKGGGAKMVPCVALPAAPTPSRRPPRRSRYRPPDRLRLSTDERPAGPTWRETRADVTERKAHVTCEVVADGAVSHRVTLGLVRRRTVDGIRFVHDDWSRSTGRATTRRVEHSRWRTSVASSRSATNDMPSSATRTSPSASRRTTAGRPNSCGRSSSSRWRSSDGTPPGRDRDRRTAPSTPSPG